MPATEHARLTRPVRSADGVEESVRVRLDDGPDGRRTTPLSRGAGMLTDLMCADGWLHLPHSRTSIDDGDLITVETIGGAPPPSWR